MNSDNVLVGSEGARLAFVDFQHTGRGHVYEDVAALETCVRINYPGDTSFGDILETERLIARGPVGRLPLPRASYAAAIRKIRAVAFSYFGRLEDSSTYHFAIAALGLRLMQAVDLSPIARARITASTLWAAKALTEGSPVRD